MTTNNATQTPLELLKTAAEDSGTALRRARGDTRARTASRPAAIGSDGQQLRDAS